MWRVWPLFLLASSGCALDEANVGERYARAWCTQQHRCNRGDYDRAFDDRAECLATTEDVVDTIVDVWEAFGCDLDPKGARQLLGSMRRARCEAFVTGDFGSDEAMFDCGE